MKQVNINPDIHQNQALSIFEQCLFGFSTRRMANLPR